MKRLLRPLFNKLASMLGVTGIQERLNRLESWEAPAHNDPVPGMLSMMERRMMDLAMSQLTPLREEIAANALHIRNEIATASLHAETRLQSLNESLVAYVDAKQSQNESTIDEFVKQQALLISEIRQSVDTIRRQLSAPSSGTTPRTEAPVTGTTPIIDDGLYVALENHFRGSRDAVAQRQQDYLPMLPTVITSSSPLIDLGCGRGEWLKVTRDHGIPSLGVDSNTVCIAECKEEKLDVVQEDLLTFLTDRPASSVGAYTLFQVLEHLPFPVLVDALREMRRTLVPGGRLIAEVPNAKNLRVSAGTFWIDPTHQRPLFPELLLFLAKEVGFSQADGHYTNDLSPTHDLSGLPDGAMNALRSVVDAVDGPGDFALIATA
jgi:O-antigen chain-terminating methyltransferase